MSSKPSLYTFTWKVENFSLSTKKTGECVTSPDFVVESLDGSKWNLKLYPKGNGDEKFLSVEIQRAESDNGPTVLTMGLKLSFVPIDGSRPMSTTSHCREFLVGQCFEFPNFVQRDTVVKKSSMFLNNDTLTIRCEMWKASSEKRVAKECLGRTKIGTERISLVWPISEFSTKRENFTTTLPVLSASKRDHIFDLTLSIKAPPADASDSDIQLDIKQMGKNNAPLYLSCHVSILNCDGQLHDSRKHEHLFEASGEGTTWSYPGLKSTKKIINEKKILLPNDILTLFLEMAFSSGTETSVIEECTFVSPSSTDTISHKGHTVLDDLMSVYNEKKFCDVKLRSGGKVFPAHKLVLCARSPVFRRLILCVDKSVDTGTETGRSEALKDDSVSEDTKKSAEVEGKETSDKDDAKEEECEDKAKVHNNTNGTAVNGKTAETDVEVQNKVTSTEKSSPEIEKNDGGDQNESTKTEVKESDLQQEQPMDQDNATVVQEKESNGELNGKNGQVSTSAKSDPEIDTAEMKIKTYDCDGNVILDVGDVDPITLQQFLYFLYTDTIENFDFDKAQKLYSASASYGVESLKDRCLSYLKSNLAVENICSFLEFADQHKDCSMKQTAQDYINTHMADILLSTEWQHFAKTKRHIAGEICDELRKKKRKLNP